MNITTKRISKLMPGDRYKIYNGKYILVYKIIINRDDDLPSYRVYVDGGYYDYGRDRDVLCIPFKQPEKPLRFIL